MINKILKIQVIELKPSSLLNATASNNLRHDKLLEF